jgi:hypothetical protein
MRWIGNMAYMAEYKNTYTILVGEISARTSNNLRFFVVFSAPPGKY